MKWELVAVITTGVVFLFLGLALGLYARKRHVTTADSSGSGAWVWGGRMSFCAGIFGALVAVLSALPALADRFASPNPPDPAKTPSSTDAIFAPGPNIGEPTKPPRTKRLVDTFAAAPGWRCANNACKPLGTL